MGRGGGLDKGEEGGGESGGGGADGGQARVAIDAAKLAQQLLWFPFFTLASVSMVLLNKYCAHSFQQPYSLLGFQNVMTIVLNFFGVAAGVFTVKPFAASQFRMFVLPTFLFVGMLVTSLYGLPYVSVATTVIFRAVSTCLVAIGDFLIFGKRFVKEEAVCMGFVVVGAVIYAANDLSYDTTGYMWMFINTAMFVVSQLYEKYAVVALDQSAVGISCIQNILSLPIVLIAGGLMHEDPIRQLQETDGWTRFAIGATGFCGCALSICYMSLVKFASATSISLAGNFNKLLSILSGAFVFHNPLGSLQVCGLATSMVATMAFAQKGQLPSSLTGSPRKAVGASMGFLVVLMVVTQMLGGSQGDLKGIGEQIKGKALALGVRASPFAFGDATRAQVLFDSIARKSQQVDALSREVQEAVEELRKLAAAPHGGTAEGSLAVYNATHSEGGSSQGIGRGQQSQARRRE